MEKNSFIFFTKYVYVAFLQGSSDPFLKDQLKPATFTSAAAKMGYPVDFRMQPQYDHSYYFISSFMRDHIDHHARALGCRPKL